MESISELRTECRNVTKDRQQKAYFYKLAMNDWKLKILNYTIALKKDKILGTNQIKTYIRFEN